MNYRREMRGDKPIVALCYDFDKTLSPDNMQAQGYIQDVDYDVDNFWAESNILAQNNGMDSNLAYMYMMVREAQGNFVLNKKALADYGAKVSLYPGVDSWFERIREYGLQKGIVVEHYIISSGLKEMIEGTSVALRGAFKEIYASSFYFDERGVAKWPAQAVNYTNKTQFLFRIQKGVLDVNDPEVNASFRPSELRVPFRNMIYIGDSDTDIPCMSLVNTNGGHSIGVYDPTSRDKEKVYAMMRANRIRYFVPADYRIDSELETLVHRIIDETATFEALQTIYEKNREEAECGVWRPL